MKIVFLGGGNMANALIGGILKQGFAPGDIDVIDPGAEARAKLAAAYAVNCHERAPPPGTFRPPITLNPGRTPAPHAAPTPWCSL